jgi:hypothetical protein
MDDELRMPTVAISKIEASPRMKNPRLASICRLINTDLFVRTIRPGENHDEFQQLQEGDQRSGDVG